MVKPTVAIIDYGMGNLYSVYTAFSNLGCRAKIITKPQFLNNADLVVLPGVGAFGQAMKNMRKAGFVKPVNDAVKKGKPFIGICLGLQLLFTKSEEDGFKATGLDIIKGEVIKFRGKIKIPHMGWNLVKSKNNNNLLKGLSDSAWMYFAHSYFVRPKSDKNIGGITDYGANFVSVACKDNVFGVQFHPEKSGEQGLQILKNFISLA